MKLPPRHRPVDFALERFLARFEFTAPHMLSASDSEPMTIGELLSLAGAGPEVLLETGLGYTDALGSPWLRERIATHYPGLEPDDILVTNAPEEAIFLSMVTLVGPGDRVVVQTPCYQALAEIARWRGADVVEWPLRETAGDAAPGGSGDPSEDGGWEADWDHLARLLATPTQLLVVNQPHNPTGWLPTHAEHAHLFELVEKHGPRLFSDEMYRGLEARPADALTPAASLHARALSLWGMSKAFGLGGLRIGWLASRDRALLGELLRLKDYTSICASAPSERLAWLALGQADAITRRHVATIAANQAVARAFGARTATLAWRRSRAGSVAFPRWRGGGVAALAERAAAEAGLVIVPSNVFDWGDGHIRLGLGRASFAASLAVLERELARLTDTASH